MTRRGLTIRHVQLRHYGELAATLGLGYHSARCSIQPGEEQRDHQHSTYVVLPKLGIDTRILDQEQEALAPRCAQDLLMEFDAFRQTHGRSGRRKIERQGA